jgi:DNA invertase Pin-like site-specific DNA recombinase
MKTSDFVAEPVGLGRCEKITSHHIDLLALLYVRQSTNHQLREHRESTERQYALANRLRLLGWPEERIVIIDQDLGCSGAGHQRRLGFQRVLAELTAERVGIVMGLEMSRLARNSKDWHDLFEVCGIFGALIADEDGVYDPHDPNDRLVLGMKGIISEMELHMMKTRLERGRLNKAQRGELFHDVPRGYVLTPVRLPVHDPDAQVRSVIQMVFDKFDELGSAHAVFRDFVRRRIDLPCRGRDGVLRWHAPRPGAIRDILMHPLYAGAYSYGRHNVPKNKRRPRGTPKRLAPEQWKVLLRDKCPAYITWDRFIRNRERLHENNTRKDRKGPAREGCALLAGILFCGHCGRRLHPIYSRNARPGYHCTRHFTAAVERACQGSIQCDVLDGLIEERIFQVLQPASIELSLRVVQDETLRREERNKNERQKTERARYDEQRAKRRYEAVDPENRLVAATLEKDWEQALQKRLDTEREYETRLQESPIRLTEAESQRLVALSSDIPSLWKSPSTNIKDRKQVIRHLVEKVVATIHGDTEIVDVTIHWAGGCLSQHQIIRRVSKYTQLQDYDQWCQRMIQLRREGKRSREIAAALNDEGFRMARHGRPITAFTVAKLLNESPFREQLRNQKLQPNEWLVEDLAKELGMKQKKLKDWVTRGWARAIQRPFGGVWILWADNAEIKRLRLLAARRPGDNRPPEETLVPHWQACQ